MNIIVVGLIAWVLIAIFGSKKSNQEAGQVVLCFVLGFFVLCVVGGAIMVLWYLACLAGIIG